MSSFIKCSVNFQLLFKTLIKNKIKYALLTDFQKTIFFLSKIHQGKKKKWVNMFDFTMKNKKENKI